MDMGHTPYGYRIKNGAAIIEPNEAKAVLKMCEGYLGGLSLMAAAETAGIEATHCQVKRMMQNEKYLGTDYYPAILTSDVMDKVKAELEKRATRLGRVFEPREKEKRKPWKDFFFGTAKNRFEDPYKQAEYMYGLIEEVRTDG
jgi:hypothetical protein